MLFCEPSYGRLHQVLTNKCVTHSVITIFHQKLIKGPFKIQYFKSWRVVFNTIITSLHRATPSKSTLAPNAGGFGTAPVDPAAPSFAGVLPKVLPLPNPLDDVPNALPLPNPPEDVPNTLPPPKGLDVPNPLDAPNTPDVSNALRPPDPPEDAPNMLPPKAFGVPNALVSNALRPLDSSDAPNTPNALGAGPELPKAGDAPKLEVDALPDEGAPKPDPFVFPNVDPKDEGGVGLDAAGGPASASFTLSVSPADDVGVVVGVLNGSEDPAAAFRLGIVLKNDVLDAGD